MSPQDSGVTNPSESPRDSIDLASEQFKIQFGIPRSPPRAGAALPRRPADRSR